MAEPSHIDAHAILSRTGDGEGRVQAASLPESPPHIEGYRLGELLGRGGMGAVWRAEQLSTRRQVALKVIALEALSSEKVRRRFEREVELAAALEHPSIARVYHSGRSGNLLYYAMELVEGVHLDAYVQRHRLKRRAVLGLMRVVCDAIRYAHQHGVIHRDLKPSNILVTADGKPHVVDFGLAKNLPGGEVEELVSITGELAGTPAYMSPEQASGEVRDVNTQSDVYSLGVILYRLLTDRYPHEMAGSRIEVLRRIAEEPVRRPSDVAPKIDTDLEALLMKALAKSPERRYASAAELERDIAAYLRDDPVAARPATIYYLARKRLAKHRVPVTVAGLMVLTVLAMALVSHIRIDQEKRQIVAARDRARRAATLARERSEELRRSLYAQAVALADAELRNGNLDRLADILESCPVDLRHWEWHYLKRRFDEGLAARALGSAAFMNFLNKMVAFASPTAAGAPVGTALTEIPFGRQSASGPIALPADCGCVATCGAEGIRLASLERGGNRFLPVPDADEIVGAALVAGGRRVAIAQRSGALDLWEVDDMDQASPADRRLGRLPSPCRVMAVSPTGAYLVCGCEGGQVVGWNLPARSRFFSSKAHAGPVVAAAYSNDGEWSATGGEDGMLVVRDAVGETWIETPAHEAGVTAVRFAPDERLLTGGKDGAIRFWSMPSGRLERTLSGHTGAVRALAVSPDGRRLFSAGDDATVRVWNTSTGNVLLVLKHRFGPLRTMRLCRAGRRVVAADAGGLTIWDRGAVEDRSGGSLVAE